jgi:hypothetical protein
VKIQRAYRGGTHLRAVTGALPFCSAHYGLLPGTGHEKARYIALPAKY